VPTAEHWYHKGVALDKASRRFAEAIECYDNALEIDPEYVEAWYGKGDALYVLARCIEHAPKVDPKYVEAWYGKEDALRRTGQWDSVLACLEGALRCFDKVLVLDPQHRGASGRKRQALKTMSRLK
jgi:tetratricopeptide (TPR) repeat protein